MPVDNQGDPMQQSCPHRLRRGAAIGAAVAVVTVSSAFGTGATAAFADDVPTAAHTVETDAPAAQTVAAGATATTDTSVATTADTAVATTPDTSVATTADQPGGTAPDTTSAHPDETTTPTDPAGRDETLAPAGTASPEGSATRDEPRAPGAPATPSASVPASVSPTPRTPAEQRAGLAFPDGTTADAPLVLEAAAGDTLDRTFTATGGTDPVTYELRGAGGRPIVGDGSFDTDYALDGATGRLSGTARLATTHDFQVVATSGSERAVEYVRLTVRPGAPVGVTFAVSSSDGDGTWQVETDGTIWEQAVGQGRVRIVPEVPVAEGSSLVLAGLAVDAYGNRTTPGGDDDPYPRSTVASTVASDRAVWSDTGSNTVSFTEAGSRSLTVSEGGVSTSFTVDVASDRSTVDPVSGGTTVTPEHASRHVVTVGDTGGSRAVPPAARTATSHDATGRLASTGADTSAPVAWALGLLAAGGGLLLHRLRRRRV